MSRDGLLTARPMTVPSKVARPAPPGKKPAAVKPSPRGAKLLPSSTSTEPPSTSPKVTEVAAWPADADLKALFGGVARAEEHVFYNVVVHALNYSAADVDVGCVTWQRCLTRGSQCSAAVLAAGSYRVPLGCAAARRFSAVIIGCAAPRQ